MNILILNSQKNKKYLNKLKKILKSYKDDKVIVSKEKIKLDHIKNLNIKLIISFHYKHIIPKKVLKFVNYNAFNFHNSFLPQNRGMYPILWSAVSNNFAACLHRVNENIDDGDIIFRKKFKISKNKTLYYAYHLLEINSLKIFKQLWKNFRKKIIQNKKIYSIKQVKNKITYNNSFKSQILLLALSNKWLTKIKDVQKKYKIICELFKT
jgi:methionyl-tRNA formyltransferase